MKANKTLSRTLHLLLAIALVLPGLFWKQAEVHASDTIWRDITADADAFPQNMTAANGNLYLLYSTGKKILVRGPSDSGWTKLVDLPANQFTIPLKLVFHGNDMYILDTGNVNANPVIPSKLMKSSDNGQTWTEVEGPPTGFNAASSVALTTLTFDTSGNLYVVDYMNIFKLDTNGVWSKISPYPEDASYLYRFTSAAVDGSGQLYSIISKVYKMMPDIQTTALYRYDGTNWITVNVTLPGSGAGLSNDANGNIYVYQVLYDFMLTTTPNIYVFDGSSLTLDATTDSFWWTIAGMAFDGSYYYIADYNTNGKIRTTNPTFGNATPSPTLTADTNDNDTTHDIELTYAADADWQAAITSVEISPTVAGASADWSQSGTITVSGLNAPASYTIKVKATGYTDATVTQAVVLKTPPTLTADTSDNDTEHALELTFTDDADWRAAITDVSIKKNGSVTNAVYDVQSGLLTLTGIVTPGDYDIQITANGYADATASQHVDLAPSVWYDITADLGLSAPALSVNDAVYALQPPGLGFSYRFPEDISWSTQAWPQGQFNFAYSFIARGNDWYVADYTTVKRVHISNDRGQTWNTYDMPQNFFTTGALLPITVSPTGAVYLFDGKNVSKLDENRDWSQIPVFPDDGGFTFNYTGIAVDSTGKLFANIRKSNPLLPLDNSAKLYQYDAVDEMWMYVADSPGAAMQLYTDTNGGMHAASTGALLGETPPALVYKIDEAGFTPTATLDNLDQARYGLAYEGGYYYTVDANFTTIRTTNPNFSTGLDAPALTADTSDNDDLHPLALTFVDDAAWRSQITSVTVTKDSSVVAATYQMTPGVLQITEPLPAGTYTIEIASTGYKKTSVQQTVQITAPALTADRSQNDTKHNIDITFTDNPVWRAAVTAVTYNGTTADSSMYELTAGKLVFFAGKLPVATHQIVVTAAGYPDASVTQAVTRPSSSSPTGTIPGANQEVIKIDVRGGSSSGNLVSQAEIIRTTDDQGKKNDQISFTSELAARAVEAIGSAKTGQAVIVVPDDKDEVASTQVSLPHDALQKLSDAGIGLTIETRGATIEIPVASLTAASDDVYFHVVPLKDSAEQQAVAERAKANSSTPLEHAAIVGRPMTIETNLQSHPITLMLPLGDYPADRIAGLRIYIEHSDGTKEWLQGEPATDETGAPAIRFTVTKFSTFTVIEAAASAQPQAYILGYEDGTFRPEQAVTRGQLAAMLSRLYGGATADMSQAPAYADQINFPTWAKAAISQVTALGLMEGYEDGTFQPDRTVTRAEIAVIAARAAKLKAAAQAAGFSDTAGHWAAEQIDAAAAAGLVDGYSDGRFEPDRTLNRAEAVTLLNRLTGRAALNDQAPHWSDVPATHWAFGDIQAASLNGGQ